MRALAAPSSASAGRPPRPARPARTSAREKVDPQPSAVPHVLQRQVGQRHSDALGQGDGVGHKIEVQRDLGRHGGDADVAVEV